MVAEAMRRYPPIIGLARVAKSDDLLGDSPSKPAPTSPYSSIACTTTTASGKNHKPSPCWSPRWPGGLKLDRVPGQRLRRELTFTGGPDGKLMMTPRSALRHGHRRG